jgi:hypothetical protein
MKTLGVASVVLAYVALLPAGGLAKGGIEATLDGPGLAEPIGYGWTDTSAEDDPARAPIEHLALASGFFTFVFADASVETYDRASRALRLRPPPGALGPRYTLTYRLWSPTGEDEIVQDVYPYAEPRPLTYIAPGQPANGSALETGGNWFVAVPELERALLLAGLPPNRPARSESFSWVVGLGLAGAAALSVAAALRARGRNRSRVPGVQAASSSPGGSQ